MDGDPYLAFFWPVFKTVFKRVFNKIIKNHVGFLTDNCQILSKNGQKTVKKWYPQKQNAIFEPPKSWTFTGKSQPETRFLASFRSTFWPVFGPFFQENAYFAYQILDNRKIRGPKTGPVFDPFLDPPKTGFSVLEILTTTYYVTNFF